MHGPGFLWQSKGLLSNNKEVTIETTFKGHTFSQVKKFLQMFGPELRI